MALILSIDTSTDVCSSALHQDGVLLAVRENFSGKSHSKLLTQMIEETVRSLDLQLSDLDAVAVSKGPGSYTGLRIGVSAAKGLCYGLDKPLIALNTLQVMAWEMNRFNLSGHLLCPMLDARRMEVYCALFNEQTEFVEETNAKIIDENSFQDILAEKKIIFFGNGSDKCMNLLGKSDNARFIRGVHPSAKSMGDLALSSFKENIFEDVAYFEPFYLKDFVSTSKSNKC